MRASRHYGDAAEANDIGREAAEAIKDCSRRGEIVPLPERAPTPKNLRFLLAIKKLDRLFSQILHQRLTLETPGDDLLGHITDEELMDIPQAMRQRRETVEHPFGTLIGLAPQRPSAARLAPA
jgi:hypothetical protein